MSAGKIAPMFAGNFKLEAHFWLASERWTVWLADRGRRRPDIVKEMLLVSLGVLDARSFAACRAVAQPPLPTTVA
jgi:hypothetical protein